MSARQNKKRKGRNHVNNRERTVTTFTEDPHTSFLVPLSSEDPPATFSTAPFPMTYQNYIAPQPQPFYQPVLPPGKNDLEILENLKSIIKDGQHEFYHAVPQPAALASLYMGHIPQPSVHPDQLPQDYPRFASADNTVAHDTTLNNTMEPHTPLSGADTSPSKLGADHHEPNLSSVQPESEDPAPVDTNADATGEYGVRQPADTASSNKPAPSDTKDGEPPQLAGENPLDRRPFDDRKARHDDRNNNNNNMAPSRTTTYENKPQNGAAADGHLPPPEDRRFHDRDRDRDRDHWDRDRDHHDFRDRNRDRDIRDRRSEFFGRSYGRSHAPRPPPELRHYEPSYGDDFVPPPRRYDDDRRGGPRSAPFDDRSKQPSFDDRRPPLDDRRPPPPPSADDDRRLALDDRPIRRLPGSDTRALPPSSEERTRPVTDPIPPMRATAENERSAPPPSLVADDRPRTNVPLEERLSQPAPTPSLQDRLSKPSPAVVPARADIAPAPSLEERLSSGPAPPRAYARAASVAREDPRVPLPKDDLRDDRVNDFRTNRDFSRERPAPLPSASAYRPDPNRSFGDRDDRDRRDRDVPAIDAPPARYGDTFGRVGPLPPRRYSPPPMFDRDRERERGRGYYPQRSPPPFRGEGVYDPDGDRRYATDRERDAYEQRRRDWYAPGDDDKRGPLPPLPPPSTSWRPHDRPPFMDRDRDRFDRERDRDLRERERERDRDLGGLIPPPPQPTRAHWDDRDGRMGFPPLPSHARMDAPGVGPGRSLSARLTDPYPPPPGSDNRAYPPPRESDRGRYGGAGVDDHPHAHGHAFSRVRNRSPSPLRRGGLADDLRPPVKRIREDNGPGYSGVGIGIAGGTYSPPRRGVGGGVGGGEYAGPPPSSAATTTTTGLSTVSGTVPARSAGTRTPPLSAPPNSAPSGAFYERDQRDREREREREQREREREREYVRGEYGMGYDRDDRGRRSPPMIGRMGGGGGGYGRGVVGDRRDDRRYVPPPPPRTS